MKYFKLICIMLGLLFFLSGSRVEKGNHINSEDALSDTCFYVALTGNDDNTGSKEEPFATISGAQNAIRELKAAKGLPEGGINVYLMEGTYKMTSGIKFTEADSGTEACQI